VWGRGRRRIVGGGRAPGSAAAVDCAGAVLPLPRPDGAAVNHGVYLIEGKAAGLFCRIQTTATDRRAVTAPVLAHAHPKMSLGERHRRRHAPFKSASAR